jgi:hypothetical protein
MSCNICYIIKGDAFSFMTACFVRRSGVIFTPFLGRRLGRKAGGRVSGAVFFIMGFWRVL